MYRVLHERWVELMAAAAKVMSQTCRLALLPSHDTRYVAASTLMNDASINHDNPLFIEQSGDWLPYSLLVEC